MNRFVLLICLALPVFNAGAQQGVKTRPTPSWIMPVDYPDNPSDTVGAGGQYYLLSEWQEHAEKGESFYRVAIKVLTERGLTSASSIQVNFDPSYQQLFFHRIVLRRNGREIDALRHAKFEILRREENMDRLIYDNSLDAMMNIEDVHVGDIIEYSYTVAGSNPVFDGKLFHKINFNFGVPIARNVDRIVCNASRKLNFKTFNNAKPPAKDNDGELVTYTWLADNVPALSIEDQVPEWYRARDVVEVSEFDTWAGVNAWALPLYTQSPEDERLLTAKVSEIKAQHLSTVNRIQAAIRFVQDEIRYLAFSEGIQGYRPHDPSKVLKQRFGDCKDKSLLLVHLLRKLGVDSHPALVHSAAGKSLDETLPMPYAFDHCIAQFVFNDSTFWIDPTITLERGSFSNSASAGYHHALVIAPGTTQLVPINTKNIASSITVYETYSFNVVGGSAGLTVKTVYAGREANSIRSYYKSTDKETIRRNYTNFYANDYPEISMIDYVTYVDDEASNTVESTEHYEIENFWSRDSLTGVYTTDFYARMISQYFDRPSTKLRKMPYALNHPITVNQTITIEVPDPWNVKKSSSEVTSPGFRFASETDYVDQKIVLHYTYRSLKDHITPGESVRHVKDCERALNGLSFELTHSPGVASTSKAFNTPFLLVGIFALPIVIFVLRRLYRYDPRSRNYEDLYEQFGGWLLLPVIGIFLTPLSILIDLFKNEYFNYLHWDILTNPSYAGFNPSLGTLILIEYLYTISLFAYSIFLIVLMVKKRTSFPLFACVLYGMNVAFLLFDSLWLSALGLPTGFEGESTTASIRAVVGAAIWIPFFIYSDRVKGTFRERL